MLNAKETPSRILLPLFAESLQATALSSLPFNAEVEDIEATLVPDLIEILHSVKPEETFAIIDAIPVPEVHSSKQAKRNHHKKMSFLASIHSETEFKDKLKAILERRKIHHSNEDKTIDEESQDDWNKEEATLVPSLA